MVLKLKVFGVVFLLSLGYFIYKVVAGLVSVSTTLQSILHLLLVFAAFFIFFGFEYFVLLKPGVSVVLEDVPLELTFSSYLAFTIRSGVVSLANYYFLFGSMVIFSAAVSLNFLSEAPNSYFSIGVIALLLFLRLFYKLDHSVLVELFSGLLATFVATGFLIFISQLPTLNPLSQIEYLLFAFAIVFDVALIDSGVLPRFSRHAYGFVLNLIDNLQTRLIKL